MAVHVVNEARRCLNCKNPMCRQGCPINTPIPQMIQAFLDNRIDEAGAMLFANNPLSLVCSLVCEELDVDKVAACCDVAFTALPHGASKEVIPALYEKGIKV